jgi:asparagine synthase (glutamine-hydrolysing)
MIEMLRLTRSSERRSLLRAARAVRADGIDPAAEPEFWRSELNWIHPTAAAGWLTPEATDLVVASIEQLAASSDDSADAESLRDWRYLRRRATDLAPYRAVAAELGLDLHTPWHDTPVLEWWDALVSWQREPAGTFKPILGELADLLPSPIYRDKKDRLGIDRANLRGIRRHASEARALIASSPLVTGGLIDLSKAGAAINRAAAAIDTSNASLVGLIGAAIWLAQEPQRHQWWERTD